MSAAASPTHHETSLADALRVVAVNGSYEASRAMSKWLRKGVRLTSDGFQSVPIGKASSIFGEPDEVIAAVYLPLVGDLGGHALLMFPRSVALKLVDIVRQTPDGTAIEFGRIERSCLEETGNIVAGAYANCLAKWLKVTVAPGVPTFIMDMASAVIDPLLSELVMHHDDVQVAMTEFVLDQHRLQWGLMLLPSPTSRQRMEERCKGDSVRLDALRTIAVNGAFNASRSVSKWLKRGVKISTPGFQLVPLNAAAAMFEENTPVAGLHSELGSQFHGHSLLVISKPSAFPLVDLLMQQPIGTTKELDEMAASCLSETANIISGSFVNSWANWLEVAITPGPPHFAVDLPAAILDTVFAEQALISDEIFLARTEFLLDAQMLEWVFYLLPSPSAMRLIETSSR